MSNQYLKTNGKKLRRRRTTKKKPLVSKQEQLYKYCTELGHLLPEKAKDEKFIPLMQRVIDGQLPAARAIALLSSPDDKLICGTVASVFKATSLLKSLISVRNVSFPDQSVDKLIVMGVREERTGRVLLVQKSGKRLMYNDTDLVYCVIQSKKQLPPDMREWDYRWANAYIAAKMMSTASDSGRTRERENPMDIVSGGVEKLHQIRKINHSPGKKQIAENGKTLQRKKKRIRNRPAYSMPLTSTSAAVAAMAEKKSKKKKLYNY
jgi:hypothetical protein